MSGVPTLQKVGGPEKTTLNVAISPVLDSAGFFVALHEGLFTQEGLTINYSPAHGDTVIGGAATGKYDIIATNYVSYIQAQASHQADLRIIAEASLLQTGDRVIMTLPRSRILALAQLKGHILGVNPDLNVGFLLAASVLTENGVPFSRSGAPSAAYVAFPQGFAMPFPDASPVLLSGKAPAVVMSEPFATELAENHGGTILADLSTGATAQFPDEGYAVTKAWARANPNTLKAFLIALEAGQEIADTNRAAVEAAFVALKPGEGHVDQRTAALMALNIYPLGVNATRLQRVADVMQQFGFLAHHFNIQQLLS